MAYSRVELDHSGAREVDNAKSSWAGLFLWWFENVALGATSSARLLLGQAPSSRRDLLQSAIADGLTVKTSVSSSLVRSHASACGSFRASLTQARSSPETPSNSETLGPFPMRARAWGTSEMRALRFLAATSATLVLGTACGRSPDLDNPSAPPVVFTEHRFAAALQRGEAPLAALPLGTDCSVRGASACASNLCVHTASTPSFGWRCSKRCLGHEDCPSGWSCVSTHPSPDASICLPRVTQ